MRRKDLMMQRSVIRNAFCVMTLCCSYVLGLTGCNDVSAVKAPPPQAAPGPFAILTTPPLPDGTVNDPYSVALAASGGTPGYSWSVATNSPQLPSGLTLSSNGIISGTPTAAGGPFNLIIQVQDSAAAQGAQQTITKTLPLTINFLPTSLTILTDSLPTGTINQPYAIALGGTGGRTPYTWGLKTGSPPLPSGLTLSPTTGAIAGTPTVTSNATHIFTLTDATSFTVEKSLPLTISSVPLSITTDSLPQGTANQNYSAQLAATGGTGNYTWGLADGSPPLPNGLVLNTASGLLSGIPTGTSNQTLTFMVSDQTPPTPQTVTKTIQLIVGAAPPTLTITIGSLPSGTVLQSYNASLSSTGGTGATTWDLVGGALPAGLTLSASGVISGTPVSPGTSTPTFRVRDSGSPQQTATKPLSITVNNPAPPTITTTSLPAGTFNVAYNQTVSVTGGIGTLVWGVVSGALPPGLSLNSSNGHISGTPTSTGSFGFRIRVTDSVPQSDEQDLTITINSPAPPSINAFTLPTGTVNQPYPNIQLSATGGTLPYTWSVSPALPNGLNLNPFSGVISGIPLSGSNGVTTHIFTVTDSTSPVHQTNSTAPKSLTITVNATPLTFTTSSLPNGTEGQPYSTTLHATGGVAPLTWSVSPALPTGLSLNASTGVMSGRPASGTAKNYNLTFTVQDSATPKQSTSRTLMLKITKNENDGGGSGGD